MVTTPNSFSSKLEVKAEESLLDLESVEDVVDAKEQAEFYKVRRDIKLAELELQEEEKGITVSTKQRRNALASEDFKNYIKDESERFKKRETNLLKRENAKIIISAWQTSVKEKGVYVWKK